MTSKVTVSAHCAPDKQVVVYLRESAEAIPALVGVVQDGESAEFTYWGEQSIITYEEEK